MRRLQLLIILIVSVHGCGRLNTQKLSSPSGNLNVSTKISGDDVGPARRLCVILTFQDTKGNEKAIQTGTSDTSKWAIDWFDDDTLILYSSDIGTHAYDVSNLQISERIASEEETNTGREAYHKRYGKYPIIH